MKHPIHHWFDEPGAYVLVDGQFGSTGKGLFAGYIAFQGLGRITHVTTNAGPNSGHTAYLNGEQVMTQQVPVASVFLDRLGKPAWTFINAGAVIDGDILMDEIARYHMDHKRVLVHPAAALITPGDRVEDEAVVASIAGTGKGIGPAIARKVMRQHPVAGDSYYPILPTGLNEEFGWDRMWDWKRDVVLVETAQGFSLGLNGARFWPHTTSRECTVGQAIADARIPAQMVKKVIMTLRTFPIRVGNTQGSSGPGYPDQKELTWTQVGVPPELTTVTKRVRRVFSWSRVQFMEACAANRPDELFLNFANYMRPEELGKLINVIRADYEHVMGRELPGIYVGNGPNTDDVSYLKLREWTPPV